jgi:tetratricopeptide (TPR) repeat protein
MAVIALLPLAASTARSDPPALEEPSATAPADETPATLAQAQASLNSGDYSRAESEFRALAEKEFNRLEAVLGLARCRWHTGLYRDGLKLLAELDAKQSADWHYGTAEFRLALGDYDDVLRGARTAREIDGNHASARLLEARTLELLGRREEAVEAYAWFENQLSGRVDLPRDPAWVTAAAQGFYRRSVLTQTQVVSRTKYVLRELLQVAYTELDRSYWPARIAAAELLREKQNNDEHDGSVSDYNAALRINSRLPEAHVGLGRVALIDWGFEEVEKHAQRALEVNPSFAPAHHLLAEKLILERRYEEAEAACDRALAVNPRDVMALSLRAAAAACGRDAASVDRLRGEVARINPRCAFFHRAVADALGGIRQYEASEGEYLAAIELDPTDANARTELGLMYMQWGWEDRARDALDAAWKLDPFNERTRNTLDLLESLQRFDRHETAHFIVRYDAKSDPDLGPFLAGYLEEMYESVTKDFQFTPKDKTLIEVFPSQAAFAVRITGKPWIHTVGACTGRVIALASPRRGGDRMGPFHLGRVLKHEFTHTVTLAATENRIPHWFTEGLAVFQEDAPRSFDWCALLADATRRGELFTLESINWGFIRPRRRHDRTMAYAQSEWMCEYMVERFGYESLGALIDRFQKGETQEEAFTRQFALSPRDFDRDFGVWAKGQVATWGFDVTPPESLAEVQALADANPDDAAAQGRLARAAFDEGEAELTLSAARRALELDENEVNAMTVMAQLLAERARKEENRTARGGVEEFLLPILERLTEAQPRGWLGPKLISEIRLRREEWDLAVEPLLRLQRLCPLDPQSWRGLAGVYLQRGEADLALPQLLELARTEEHDPDVPARIAALYRQKDQGREALYWYRQALLIDPFNVAVHQAMGEAALRQGDTSMALQSFRMLTFLEPGTARHFESAALAAHKMGRIDDARAWARKAVELDPRSGAKSLLGEGGGE